MKENKNNEMDVMKIEFLITLNDNIIIQRFFNVRDFNSEAKYSMELYYYLKNFANDFAYDLKMRSVVYLLENREHIESDSTILETSFTDGPEYFNIYLKIGEQTICHRIVDAKPYPPKVRYTVDIRPQVKTLLRGLTDIFSRDEFSFDYCDIQTIG
jgi:hypothetical protein